MEPNSSREASSDDIQSEEAREEDECWLCECGVARVDPSSILDHVDDEQHIAERVDTATGDVTGIIAGGYNESKYGENTPYSAQIDRKAHKNEPLFPR